MNNEAAVIRITRWIENAKRNNANMLKDLQETECVSPTVYAARIQDNLAKIEAWQDVLRVLN